MFNSSADVIATDLEHELVLLDPRNGEMFALNATGRRVWFALPARTPDELAHVLTANFDVAPAQALKDVQSLIAALQGAGLVWYDDDELTASGVHHTRSAAASVGVERPTRNLAATKLGVPTHNDLLQPVRDRCDRAIARAAKPGPHHRRESALFTPRHDVDLASHRSPRLVLPSSQRRGSARPGWRSLAHRSLVRSRGRRAARVARRAAGRTL